MIGAVPFVRYLEEAGGIRPYNKRRQIPAKRFDFRFTAVDFSKIYFLLVYTSADTCLCTSRIHACNVHEISPNKVGKINQLFR